MLFFGGLLDGTCGTATLGGEAIHEARGSGVDHHGHFVVPVEVGERNFGVFGELFRTDRTPSVRSNNRTTERGTSPRLK